MSDSIPVLVVYAGQNNPIPIAFMDSDGVAIDLTGAVMYMTAKALLSDTDAKAFLDLKVISHTSAVGGISALPMDLTELDKELFSNGAKYMADIFLKDSGGNVIPYGSFILEVKASPTRATND